MKKIIDKTGTKISEVEKDLKNKEKEVSDLSAELDFKTSELKTKIDELNDLLSQKEEKIQQLNEIIIEKDKFIEEQTTQIKELNVELGELKPIERTGDFSSEGRKICPKCGAVGHEIKVVEDKSNILSYIGSKPMYGKKNVCKKCGHEF